MSSLIFLVPLALVLWMVLRGRKQQREAADVRASLVPGQRVMTSSGLYARVVEVVDSTIVLEPADGVRTTWALAAVARVVPEPVETVEPAEAEGPVSGATAGTTVIGTPTAGTATSTPGAAAGGAVRLSKPEHPER